MTKHKMRKRKNTKLVVLYVIQFVSVILNDKNME